MRRCEIAKYIPLKSPLELEESSSFFVFNSFSQPYCMQISLASDVTAKIKRSWQRSRRIKFSLTRHVRPQAQNNEVALKQTTAATFTSSNSVLSVCPLINNSDAFTMALLVFELLHLKVVYAHGNFIREMPVTTVAMGASGTSHKAPWHSHSSKHEVKVCSESSRQSFTYPIGKVPLSLQIVLVSG